MSVPASPPSAPRPVGTVRLATVGGTQILVSYTTLLFAAVFAVILAPQVEAVRPGLGPLRYLAGAVFAALLYLAVLLHEISHALVARRFGTVVPSITLHFLGGMTAVQGEARSPRQEFWVAVVGPLTSLAVGGVAWLAYQQADQGLVGLFLFGLAAGNLLIGVLNLVPGLPLDGGRVFKAAVWKVSGSALRGVVVAAWAGRATAVVLLAWPLLAEAVLDLRPGITDYVVAFLLAAFIWTTASAELANARLRSRFPALEARRLARRTLSVPHDLPLAEAVRRAQDAQAGGIVTLTAAGVPVGVVNEAALVATPEDRRPWVPTSSVARSLEPGLSLPVGLRGEELVTALNRAPAREYLLVQEDGSVYGVLSLADVDRAVRGAGGAR
ncbi:Putative zinc metalloprotease Rip3 [Nocardioides aquaticus]|uniref:Zinc metalloprotease n=1 Tax=Nocardioides aquaticus TaxID=160826 RepID=A0ABX8EIU5_9ACTN|nr:site-2 protease family protein [Nocardioides aquaticus]QVT80017.1 Putative zinc metalloprotease Rip3 [Nocardioides aquaticus]